MKIPAKYIFTAVWFVLLLLLFGMFGLSHFNLHALGTGAIFAIAGIQMFLVLIFFMRLRQSPNLIRVLAATGFFWLLILFVLAFSDYLTRQWH
jgi:cytochrome c oxidase subunit IV